MKPMKPTSPRARFALHIGMLLFPGVAAVGQPSPAPPSTNAAAPRVGPLDRSAINLAAIPFKIVHETFRETDGVENWELQLINADGSNPVNLTRTPRVDELYPHASPDGTQICFVAEEQRDNRRVRDLYYMNLDGTGRVKIAENAREGCWSPDGKIIAFTKGEYEKFSSRPFASKGVFYYDVVTRQVRPHPNKALHHLYNICWSPSGKWLVASVTGGMGFSHSIVAFEAEGSAVINLEKYGIDGCRPDLGPDGRMITYGKADSDLYIAEIDLTMAVPRVGDIRPVVKSGQGYDVSHTDLSPDGKYLAFGYGPEVDYSVGLKAPGWNICISDLSGQWVQVTTDGKHNKEPDWVLIRK